MQGSEAASGADIIRLKIFHCVSRWAYNMYYVGCLLLVWGLYDEGAEVFAILVEHNLLGEAMATMTEAFLNFMMLSICFVDVIFAGLVKLRLFNGYMSDDVVLTRFCLLHGYAQDLNRQFTEGASQMKKQMSMEVGSHFNCR